MKTNVTIGTSFRLSVLLLLLAVNVYYSQESKGTKTIQIHVVDANSKEDIPFANVVAFDLEQNQLGVSTTDLDGFCTLILPAKDDYVLKAIYIGYQLKADTLSCQLPGCNRQHTMKLNYVGFDDLPDGIVDERFIENEEDVQELERMLERAEEESEIREDLNDFVCYPNPSKEKLNIQINGVEATEVLMMNIQGQLIIQRQLKEEEESLSVDLSGMAKGAYYVVCRGAGLSSHTQTIIKE